MDNLVAVSEKGSIWKLERLKNYVLFFDKIYVPTLEIPEFIELDILHTGVSMDDVNYLKERGILHGNPIKHEKIFSVAVKNFTEEIIQTNAFNQGDVNRKLFGSHLERVASKLIEENLFERAVPVSPIPLFEHNEMKLNKDDILYFVMYKIPVISEDVPFDELLDFRTECISLNNDLQRWVTKVAKEELGKAELNDEIEDLLYSYRKYEKIGELKFRPGKIEIACTVATMLKKLFTLNFEGISKSLCTMRKGKAELMEWERKNPGRALSLVIKAQERFG